MVIVNPAVAVAVLLRPLEPEGVEEQADDKVLAGGFLEKCMIIVPTVYHLMLTVPTLGLFAVVKSNVPTSITVAWKFAIRI